MKYHTLKNQIPPIHPLDISSASNGYIVNAGCKTFVFDSAGTLVSALADYLADPELFVQVNKILSYPGETGPPPMGLGGSLKGPAIGNAAQYREHIHGQADFEPQDEVERT